MNYISQIDKILSPESDEYASVARVTQYLNSLGTLHRHIFDVMRQIKALIPEHIFSKYAQEYLWIINDCSYRAPEAFFESWRMLLDILIKIKHEHPSESFVDDIKMF